MKLIRKIVLIAFLLFISCKSKEYVNYKKESNELQFVLNSIEKDTLFINKIKTYYPDFNTCSQINFIPDSSFEYKTLRYFSKQILTNTKTFKEYKDLNDLKFKSIVEEFDSINDFYYPSIKSKEEVSESEFCNVKLFFSNKIDNLMLIKFSVIGEKMEVKSKYQPRVGYYLLEFNQNNKIIHRFFVFISN